MKHNGKNPTAPSSGDLAISHSCDCNSVTTHEMAMIQQQFSSRTLTKGDGETRGVPRKRILCCCLVSFSPLFEWCASASAVRQCRSWSLAHTGHHDVLRRSPQENKLQNFKVCNLAVSREALLQRALVGSTQSQHASFIQAMEIYHPVPMQGKRTASQLLPLLILPLLPALSVSHSLCVRVRVRARLCEGERDRERSFSVTTFTLINAAEKGCNLSH